eukprot:14906883-Ditylum_brightwellii.AAC.1
MDMFVTLSCNQKKHFGITAVKTWIDRSEWQSNFPGWNSLTRFEKEEVSTALKYIKSSLFKRVESIFARSDEVKGLIQSGVFKCMDDYKETIKA